jgi:protein Mpv17
MHDLKLYRLIVAVGWFFTSMSLMEGKGSSGVADSLKTVRARSRSNITRMLTLLQTYAPTLMRGWCAMLTSLNRLVTLTNVTTSLSPYRMVFTPTQIINFMLVPPQFRFVFMGVVSLVWSTFSALFWDAGLTWNYWLQQIRI